MPRSSLTNAYIAALGGGNLYPAYFVEIYFASGPIRVCTCYQPQLLNNQVYSGVGSELDISTIEDGASIQARGVTVTLSGIDPTELPAALTEFQVGLSATIYLALFAADGKTMVNNTVVAWAGRTDQPTISGDEKSASISINLESLLLDMNTPVPYRYTDVDQRKFYPNDLGFMWVNSIQSIPIYWGQNSTSSGNP